MADSITDKFSRVNIRKARADWISWGQVASASSAQGMVHTATRGKAEAPRGDAVCAAEEANI